MLTCPQHEVSASKTETLGGVEVSGPGDLLLQGVQAKCQSERERLRLRLQVSSAQRECRLHQVSSTAVRIQHSALQRLTAQTPWFRTEKET